jgi:hypothetical protein
VVQEVGISKARVFQGIRQDWHPVEGTLVVDGLGDLGDCAVIPVEAGGADGNGVEGVAENVAEEGGLGGPFDLPATLTIATNITSAATLTALSAAVTL